MIRAETSGTQIRTAKAEAMDFLRAALVGDPVPAAELSRVAHERGLTPKPKPGPAPVQRDAADR